MKPLEDIPCRNDCPECGSQLIRSLVDSSDPEKFEIATEGKEPEAEQYLRFDCQCGFYTHKPLGPDELNE